MVDGGLAQGMGECVARGDVGTVNCHVDGLDAFSPEMASLYRRLALRTMSLAHARGTLSPLKAAEIEAVLDKRQVTRHRRDQVFRSRIAPDTTRK